MNWSDLPESLAVKAVLLSGEPAWPPEAAREAIRYLSSKDLAVVSVEAWIPEHGSPRVVGWSDYKVANSRNWKEYVTQNALQALKTIDDSELKGALYNLTWIEESASDER